MIQAFSHIFNFFNIASPCGDMFYFFRFYYSITIVNKGKNNFMMQKVKTRILGGFFKT
jgi:hypothetical protein